jgi:hypothetical protein
MSAQDGTPGNRQQTYLLTVDGELGPRWTSWFEDAAVCVGNGCTTLVVPVIDQAGLHGALRRIYGLNLTLLSAFRIDGELVAGGGTDA